MQSLTTLFRFKSFLTGKNSETCGNEPTNNSKENEDRHQGPKGVGLLVVFISALFLAGIAYGGYFDRVRTYISGPVETYLLSAGITLQKIVIKGQVALSDEEVVAALGIRAGQSLFGFDAIKAQAQLSKLGKVRAARVMRLLPSTLLIEIDERAPFARWLRDGQMLLIDADGVVLQKLSGTEGAQYPLISGAGAGEKAAHLIRILSTHEGLASRIAMAERVGRYRWNLHAENGALIKLPPSGLALGLARFVNLPEWSALLERKNLIVDLRQPGQAFVNEVKMTSARSVSGT